MRNRTCIDLWIFGRSHSCYRNYQQFYMQTRRKGELCFLLTLLPRLYAVLNELITCLQMKYLCHFVKGMCLEIIPILRHIFERPVLQRLFSVFIH